MSKNVIMHESLIRNYYEVSYERWELSKNGQEYGETIEFLLNGYLTPFWENGYVSDRFYENISKEINDDLNRLVENGEYYD